MLEGRDAADVAISNTFGPNTVRRLKVRTDEVSDTPPVWAEPIPEFTLVRGTQG
jgi:hypothetical protein